MSVLVPVILMPMAAAAYDSGDGGAASVFHVYVGSYAQGQDQGIYLLEFDASTGRLALVGRACETESPSFLALHPSLPVVYSVGETTRPEGTVSAWRIDEATGCLSLINAQSSRGLAPCHISVAPSTRHVAVANYVSGSVVLLPIREDGGLDGACAVVQHEGSGPNASRQEGPHAHSVFFDPSGSVLIAADLGIDKVLLYRYDAQAATISPHEQPYVAVAPGAGPRHLAHHPSGRFVYVVNELDSTVTMFQRDPDSGTLVQRSVVSTLPAGFEGESTTAEVRVHPSGRFLYASNRGHDSIAVFAIGLHEGLPTPVGHRSTGGRTPRNFSLDPTGRYLLAANQDSDSVNVFQIDRERGMPEPTGGEAAAPRPVCLVFREKRAGAR